MISNIFFSRPFAVFMALFMAIIAYSSWGFNATTTVASACVVFFTYLYLDHDRYQ